MIKKIIPVSKPFIGYSEYKYALKSLLNNRIGSASDDNSMSERIIANTVQHEHCKLTSNGTVALQVAFEAAKHVLLKDTLTIIIPNVTFGATVNAALLTSNDVILADVDAKTGLLCRKAVEEILKTRDVDCICLVSLNGRLVPSQDVEYYSELGLLVIEDQAEAFISRYEENIRKKYIFMSTLSFYANKIVTSGEGGAICFSDGNIIEWINAFVNHGMIKAGSYRHDIVGSNYRMSSYNASLLRGQLSRIDKVIQHRQKLWAMFSSSEHGLIDRNLYGKNELPWLLEYQCQKHQQEFEDNLLKNKIQYRRYFTPMSDQGAFEKLSVLSLSGSTEFIKNRYFLPLYYGMKTSHVLRIIAAAKS